MEDPTDDLGFGFVYFEFFVYKPESVGSIAVHVFAKLHSLYDGEPLVLRYGLRFFLCDCCESIKKHFIAEGKSVDSFLFELDSYSEELQLADV